MQTQKLPPKPTGKIVGSKNMTADEFAKLTADTKIMFTGAFFLFFFGKMIEKQVCDIVYAWLYCNFEWNEKIQSQWKMNR